MAIGNSTPYRFPKMAEKQETLRVSKIQKKTFVVSICQFLKLLKTAAYTILHFNDLKQVFFNMTTPLVDGGIAVSRKEEHLPSPSSKLAKVWDFVRECIFKEFGSCLRHLCYRAVFCIDPNRHNLNPKVIKAAQTADSVAKVVLLLPGQGAHPSSFFPLAEKFQKTGIENIYTVSSHQTKEDPVPVVSLARRISELTERYLKKGYGEVDYILVGHSLGAIIAAKYIWGDVEKIDRANVSTMIAIAGRLKYIPNRFSWFCESVKPEIEKTFRAFSLRSHLAKLYTIWGERDAIVPKQSVHIQGETSREFTVKGWGHGGVVFAPEGHDKIVGWITAK